MDPVSLICPVIDARNARVYASLYRDGKEMMKPCALSCDVLCEKLKSEYSGEKILFTGDGIFANRTRFTELLGRDVPTGFRRTIGGNPAQSRCLHAQNMRQRKQPARFQSLQRKV